MEKLSGILKLIRPDFDLKAVGKRIALLRQKDGLTLKQLSVRLKVTAAAISQWEHGDLPSLDMLKRLAEFGETDAAWIITGVSDKPPRWPQSMMAGRLRKIISGRINKPQVPARDPIANRHDAQNDLSIEKMVPPQKDLSPENRRMLRQIEEIFASHDEQAKKELRRHIKYVAEVVGVTKRGKERK